MKPDCVLMVGVRMNIAPSDSVLALPSLDDASQGQAVATWLERVMPVTNRRLAVILPSQTKTPGWLEDTLAQHWHRAAIAQLTIQKNGANWARNFIRSLRRRPKWATTARDCWRGLPAFVVGAGSSLDKNGALLREAQRKGPIIALNSSAGCCRHHGIEPDLIVCCEHVPLASHLQPFGDVTVAIDALASPLNWAAAQHAIGFCLHEPYLARYMVDMGVPPLHYSTSSATAAMSLATWWGADTVVMVGQDNGTSDGRPYGAGSPFSDMRAEVRNGLLCYEGPSKDPYKTPAVYHPGWNSGELVPSDHTFDGVIKWTSEVSQRVTIINATEGGVSIERTIETPLAAVLASLADREHAIPDLRDADPTAVLDELKRDAEQHLTADMPDPRFSLIHMWTVPASLGLRHYERKDVLRETTRKAAAEILEVLCES